MSLWTLRIFGCSALMFLEGLRALRPVQSVRSVEFLRSKKLFTDCEKEFTVPKLRDSAYSGLQSSPPVRLEWWLVSDFVGFLGKTPANF